MDGGAGSRSVRSPVLLLAVGCTIIRLAPMIGIIIGAAALVVLYLVVEAAGHSRRLRAIPVRIHVNGTRGKTSVTRLLAASLRAAGVRTVAKVTGDEPLLILPDGEERRIRRLGPARIQEQVWFVRQAARLKADAIVVECMALAGELQQTSEEKMIRSTVGVITNVRPDHFEVMGDSLDAVAQTLAATIPRDAVLVTADRRYFPQFATWAAARGSRAVLATGGEAGSEPAKAESEHAAIVTAVCRELQTVGWAVSPAVVPREGRQGAPAEQPGTRTPALVHRLEQAGRRVFLVNAFSANDPVSTRLLQKGAAESVGLPEPRVALLNNRADRPRRMLTFVEALRTDNSFAAVALCGGLAPLARRRLRAAGCDAWVIKSATPAAMIDEIGRHLGHLDFTLVGMGNAKGAGLACAHFFAEKGVPCP